MWTASIRSILAKVKKASDTMALITLGDIHVRKAQFRLGGAAHGVQGYRSYRPGTSPLIVASYWNSCMPAAQTAPARGA